MYQFGSPGGLGLQLYAAAFTAGRLSNIVPYFSFPPGSPLAIY